MGDTGLRPDGPAYPVPSRARQRLKPIMLVGLVMRTITGPGTRGGTPRNCAGQAIREAAMLYCSGSYIRLYLGPLPPSRGVHLGPSTSVALQSTQFGAFTRRAPCASSYTPAGHIRA
jgi:hypothetical protein